MKTYGYSSLVLHAGKDYGDEESQGKIRSGIEKVSEKRVHRCFIAMR